MGACIQQPVVNQEISPFEKLDLCQPYHPAEQPLYLQSTNQPLLEAVSNPLQNSQNFEPQAIPVAELSFHEKFDLPVSSPISQIYLEEPLQPRVDSSPPARPVYRKLFTIKVNSLWDSVRDVTEKRALATPLPDFELKNKHVTAVPIYESNQDETKNIEEIAEFLPKHGLFDANHEQSFSVDSKDAVPLDFQKKEPPAPAEPSQRQIMIQSSKGEQLFVSFAPRFFVVSLDEHKPKYSKAVSLDQEVLKINNEHVVHLLEQLESIPEQSIPDILTLGPYVILDTGDIYLGQWKNGLRHGQGRQVFDRGQYYEGQWANDEPNGYGRLIYQNGDYYTGEFLNGMRHGRGVMVFNDGSTHEGLWAENLKHGPCKERAADGTVFSGEYVKGFREGQGRLDYADGSIFEGEFKKGEIEGKGTQTWPDGRRYEGEWKEGMMHGEGFFFWNEGKMYKGQYVKNLRHGHGDYHWPDGRTYKGGWRLGMMHGQGIMVWPDQRIEKGVWKNGEKQLNKQEYEKMMKEKEKAKKAAAAAASRSQSHVNSKQKQQQQQQHFSKHKSRKSVAVSEIK